jgi:hypothetical protein
MIHFRACVTAITNPAPGQCGILAMTRPGRESGLHHSVPHMLFFARENLRMQALLKAPDCFTMVVALLDPHELQRMRCVSKGIYRGTTKEMMIQCIKSTIARYSGPHAMPNGTVRFYSTFGKSTYDICKIEDGYQLKQEGLPGKKLEINSPAYTYYIAYFANKMDHLLSDSSLLLTSIHENVGNMHERTLLGFEVKTEDGKTIYPLIGFTFKQPDGSPAPTRSDKKMIIFKDLYFYRRRLNEERPTLLQQLFEAKDKISALESEKTALQTRLANTEAQDRRREEKVTLK